MNRIDSIFRDLRTSGRKALMPFLTAGDPDMPTTARLLKEAEESGASVCELGIPFSDPIADGPVIQESMNYALEHGLKIQTVLESVAAIRPRLKIGVVCMVSCTVIVRRGGVSFVRDCAQAGFDGFILPDLPVEEADSIRDAIAKEGLTASFLISPTTPPERARKIAGACTGFIYVLARSGVTGERSQIPADLADRLTQLREVTDLPLAVGFGVSAPQQVRQVTRVADAAIVGSALVRKIAAHRRDGADVIVAQAGAFMKELTSGLFNAGS